jgi:NADH dehydrogenase FAD-containing subunit
MNTPRLFEGMALPDVAASLNEMADDLADDNNETVQALRVVLVDAAERIKHEHEV